MFLARFLECLNLIRFISIAGELKADECFLRLFGCLGLRQGANRREGLGQASQHDATPIRWVGRNAHNFMDESILMGMFLLG